MSGQADNPVRFSKLRLRLLKLAQEDQEARRLSSVNDRASLSWLKRDDEQRAEEVLAILKTIKTPSFRNIGSDGSYAVWLIAQHNPDYKNLGDVVLRKMLYLYRKDKSQVYHKGIPFLIDRLMILKQMASGIDAAEADNLHLHAKQLYGTQFRTNSEGEMVKFKVMRPAGLQNRRKKFGLPPDD